MLLGRGGAMDSDPPACPRGHDGESHRVRRDGWATTKDGRRQMFRCIAPDGTAHRFYGPLSRAPVSDGRRSGHYARCPRPGHSDGTVQSRGLRTDGTGIWRRYSCRRPNGEQHTFRVMVLGSEATEPRSVPGACPACPEHPDSRVVRAGTYRSGGARRQRYQCHPLDEGKVHQFTPPLARQAVSLGDACTRCDELLSPHHGPIAAARHTPWTLTGIVKALNDLSLGESYANVSLALRAQRDAAREHLKTEHNIDALGPVPTTLAVSSSPSHSRSQKKNAWRVAADLVEQYSPLLFGEVETQLQQTAQSQRAANDLLLETDPNATLETPLVYVLDELPIWTRSNGIKRPSWNVLTVAEVQWKQPNDPFLLPQRDSRLRVARAFPRSNADAWQLVFDELQVRPDFIVADYGTGLQTAIKAYYGSTVGVVPSLWHVHRNLRDVLLELPHTTYLEGKERVLIDPLRKHLSQLARDELLGRTSTDIASWWDELEALVADLPAPVSTIKTQRDMHEPRLIDALPILHANPHVPASNAAVENRIRNLLKPFLENRSHLFGNQERTNRLLNLLVCREAGTFTDLDALALRIREFNETNGGWAPAPRQIIDRQPPTSTAPAKPFRSLKSHNVVARLAKDRGIATQAQKQANAPMPLLTKKSAQRLASLEIREWARTIGLPVSSTGGIKDGVLAAYKAHQGGATDEQAREVYQQSQDEISRRRAEHRKARRAGGHKDKDRAAELKPIRDWAEANGYEVSRNAVIPDNVMDAYQAAQQGTTRKRRPSKQPRKKKP